MMILSLLTYIASFIAIAMTGIDQSEELNQTLLVISYAPFLVTLAWAFSLGWSYFGGNVLPARAVLLAFSMHALVFIGWLVIMLVHFSIFRPHA